VDVLVPSASSAQSSFLSRVLRRGIPFPRLLLERDAYLDGMKPQCYNIEQLPDAKRFGKKIIGPAIPAQNGSIERLAEERFPHVGQEGIGLLAQVREAPLEVKEQDGSTQTRQDLIRGGWLICVKSYVHTRSGGSPIEGRRVCLLRI
jgi:hypothetical protein